MHLGNRQISSVSLRNEIISFVDRNCAQFHGLGFKINYTPRCLSTPFTETYIKKRTLLGDRWHLVSPEGSQGTLSAIQDVLNQLPVGLDARIEKREGKDGRNYDAPISAPVYHEIYYFLTINVSQQYASSKHYSQKETYKAKVLGDSRISPAFSQNARAYITYLTKEKPGLISAMTETIKRNADHFDLKDWKVTNKGVFSDYRTLLLFSHFGLTPLENMEQAYGLAYSFAEGLSGIVGQSHYRYQLRSGFDYISVYLISSDYL